MAGYDLRKIKYSCDGTTFLRACEIYNSGKIQQIMHQTDGVSAVVTGNNSYKVSVSSQKFGFGRCECYLGQNDELCKHLVALSIYVVKNGEPLTDEDMEYVDRVKFSGHIGELTDDEVVEYRINVSKALKLIKSWSGGSKGWFEYQVRLCESCGILTETLSKLPASRTNAGMVIKLLTRLDAKLLSGIDDSDGTVGEFMMSAIELLNEFAKAESECRKEFEKIDRDRPTCFGWWEDLDIRE